MRCRVVTLGDEDTVLLATLQRLVDGDWRTHELLFNRTQAFKARLELEVVVDIVLGNGRDDGDVVTLRADVVCRRDHRDVDI